MVLANVALKKSEVSSPRRRGSPRRTAVRLAVMSVPWKKKLKLVSKKPILKLSDDIALKKKLT